MFTWNFQMISKSRLIEAFNQLKLNSINDDILIRIHTAAHEAEEAVELARYIKGLVPNAKIFGTSTSAIIINGKLVRDQCVVSVTQMNGGYVKTAKLPTFNDDNSPLTVDELCSNVKDAVIDDNTKVLLTFLTVKYVDVNGFIDKCNDYFPGVVMTGGLADASGSNISELPDNTFVFDENGWTEKGIILAAIGGNNIESFAGAATGLETIGDDIEITDAFGSCILSFDGKDAATEYRRAVGEEIKNKPDLFALFPYAYSDEPTFPVFVTFMENVSIEDIFPTDNPLNKPFYDSHPDIYRGVRKEVINANHSVKVGRKMKKAFIYDRKIISDNRTLFQRIEAFEKAETIFAYSCIVRSVIYSNCVQWELSAYENSNMSGCITYGEIVNINGKNKFVSGSFVITAMGEEPVTQVYNPYAFIYTEALAHDNEELLTYLTGVENRLKQNDDSVSADALKSFVRDIEMKILVSDKLGIPNLAALNIDMKTRGVDRLCIIDIFDIISMKTVYSDQHIQLTYKNYISKIESFVKNKNYEMYIVNNWRIAIGSKSYMTSLSEFTGHMESLQKMLFNNNEEFIPIIPIFVVINNCTVDNYMIAYNSSIVKMNHKNLQFYQCNATDNRLDEDDILEKYHMVNVINYAIENNKVVPHFHGIYDNHKKCINRYEALMRLEDENGRIYYPNSFLDVARSYGILYDRISFMMIKKVLKKFEKSKDFCVSINLGMRDIRNSEIVSYIYDFLSTVKNPGNFEFELLENEDIDDYNEMIRFVDKIHDLGGKIAIDDFGSGFSNLLHIISLNADCIKIDGSIVKNSCINEGAENMIALISTWKNLTNKNIDIVAEFVENEEIQQKLIDYNIEYSQGFLFSKPTPDIDV